MVITSLGSVSARLNSDYFVVCSILSVRFKRSCTEPAETLTKTKFSSFRQLFGVKIHIWEIFNEKRLRILILKYESQLVLKSVEYAQSKF